MRSTAAIAGLYAITDAALQPPERLPRAVAEAVRGGARIVQYRDKGNDRGRRVAEAEQLAAVCHEAGAIFLVNDDVALAAACGADGVHLGRDDDDPASARQLLGDAAIVGVSCYAGLERALAAETDGADYVAFGSVFASRVKPDAPRAPLSLFTAARERLRIPVVGIGGIDADNAPAVIEAGADAVAVITDVFAATDVTAAARRIAVCFAR